MSNGQDIESILGVDRHRRLSRRLIWLALAAVLVLVLLAAFLFFQGDSGSKGGQKLITQEVVRRDLDVTITATGTLEPVTKVDVGSELSGIIETVEADFNDVVKAGQALATLDTTSLHAQVIQAKASLNSARAKLSESRATLKESEAELNRLKKGWELSGGKVPSQRELDAADAAFERAKAAVVTAEAQVAEAQASLTVKEDSLSKAVIRSPIDGVVLNRAVEPGQTVAASLQAPVLFTIAETLTQMELHVFVDEADVGQIQEDQDATFTVDAYPDRTFNATITEVRFTPTETEGVVTYETVLMVDNPDLSLRPGMTATAVVTTAHVENALLVPNAALRFSPKQLAQTEQDGGSLMDKLLPRRHRRPKSARKNNGLSVWLPTGDPEQPVSAVPVKTGASDGSLTVVLEGKLEAGQKVVVGVEAAGK